MNDFLTLLSNSNCVEIPIFLLSICFSQIHYFFIFSIKWHKIMELLFFFLIFLLKISSQIMISSYIMILTLLLVSQKHKLFKHTKMLSDKLGLCMYHRHPPKSKSSITHSLFVQRGCTVRLWLKLGKG
jgi:hypothetical protein